VKVNQRQTEDTNPQSLPFNSTPQLAECMNAIEELCSNEGRLKKLRRYAGRLVFGITAVRQYAEAGDLLNEALLRTLDGRRKWKPEKVDLDTHLKGCMRSIANGHTKEAARYATENTPVEPSFQEHRTDLLLFDKTRSWLKGDETASRVLDLLLDSYLPTEIRRILNLKTGVYNAARARVSRWLRRIAGRKTKKQTNPSRQFIFCTSRRGDAGHAQAH
jgi:DNA-directed RNA polymerase specialized sigma24 family protein